MADKYLPSPSLRQVILKIYFIFIFILHIFPDWREDTAKVKCPTHAGNRTQQASWSDVLLFSDIFSDPSLLNNIDIKLFTFIVFSFIWQEKRGNSSHSR